MTNEPRQISDKTIELTIAGYLVIMSEEPGRPALFGMPDTDDMFIALFSSAEKLADAVRTLGITAERVGRVSDGREFMDDVARINREDGRPYKVRVAVDIYRHTSGKVRFTEPLTSS